MANPWVWESVTDWQKRTAAYDEKQKAFYDTMVPLFDQLRALQRDSGWSVIEEKDGVVVEFKKSERGILMMRANATLDYPPKDVFRFMQNIDYKYKWDINVDKVAHVKKVGVNGMVSQLKTKKVLIVSSRDFVVNYLCNWEEDGTIIDVQTSNSLYVDVPEQPNAVRCFVYINGVILKPKGTNQCEYFVVSETDIKGIPDWVIKQAFKDQVVAVNGIRKYLP